VKSVDCSTGIHDYCNPCDCECHKVKTMRYSCYFCQKSVTSEVPKDTVIRAILICPECIEARQVIFREDIQTPQVKK